MKLGHLKILIITIVLLVLNVLNLLVFNLSNIYIISLVIVFLIVLIKFIVGYERSRNRYHKDSIMNIFIVVMLFYIFTYIIGIFIGFVRSGYSLTFLGLVRNILPLIILIISTEVLRYMLNKKISDSNRLLILSTIAFVTLDIMLGTVVFNIVPGNDIIGIFALIVLPSISKNIVLGYTTLKFGFIPAIVYRLLMEVPEYFLPIFPNFNEYIDAIVTFLIPLIILFFIAKTIKKEEKKDSSLNKNIINKVVTVSLIVLMISIISLTSGVFKYYAISIGSGSMSPNIKVGDVAIVEKTDNLSNIEADDVLVFKQNEIIVVHRVEEKYEENGHIKFKTKGDNNKDVDNWIVNESDVIGTVKFKLSLIGYPTVWLSKQIN